MLFKCSFRLRWPLYYLRLTFPIMVLAHSELMYVLFCFVCSLVLGYAEKYIVWGVQLLNLGEGGGVFKGDLQVEKCYFCICCILFVLLLHLLHHVCVIIVSAVFCLCYYCICCILFVVLLYLFYHVCVIIVSVV